MLYDDIGELREELIRPHKKIIRQTDPPDTTPVGFCLA